MKKTNIHSINIKLLMLLLTTTIALAGCTISYKFNGASIDYTKTKTISIADFSNSAELVHPPFASQFSEKLRDIYTRNTRLQVLKRNGDMHIEGEIVEYSLTPMAIGADAYASKSKLTVTINVRFTNKKNPTDDFEKKYSAFETFDTSTLFTTIQEDLSTKIIENIVDNVYNETVAKW
jgi:Lipopolysaccharide-assembly